MTDEVIQEALRADKGPDASLVSWKFEDFTMKGDNYTCLVTCLVVQYTLGGKLEEATYVAKMRRNIAMDTFASVIQKLVKWEGTCLAEIVPCMNKILKELGHRGIGTAKAYHCVYEKDKEVLLLEDLRSRGFRMYDRKRGMDIPHARLVLQELGRLHAASILLEKSLPEQDITKTWSIFQDMWESTGDTKKMLDGMTASQLEGAAMIMEKVPNYEHVVKWINQVKGSAADVFMENSTSDPTFAVLVHGDCWTNNLLFRYNAAGDPVEVMLVDLQGMRRVSPAVDLNYFLYSSFNGPDRSPNVELFLGVYYTSFCEVLRAANTPVPFTLEELRQEYRRKMEYGCIAGMFVVPIILSEVEDAPDFEGITDDKMEEFAKQRQEVLLKMISREDGLLKPRFLDMFDEMVEAGIIPRHSKGDST